MARSLYPRILDPPEASFLLLGARGVGKTAWAGERYPEAHRIDLADESLYQDLLADPSLFVRRLRARPEGSWVVVDEIQRLPDLLDEVRRFLAERRLRFAILASSARRLEPAAARLPPGRLERRTMLPLVPEELGADFDLERLLRHGTLPVVWTADDPRRALEAYVERYLRDEIRAEGRVRNLAGFARFLPIAGRLHGRTLNLAALARDAGTPRTTVAGYLEVLEDTLLARRLPAFEAGLRARERRHPRLHWIDPGLARAVQRRLGPIAGDECGPAFEGWIRTLLEAYDQRHELYDEIFYWAPAQARQTRVDFLLRRGAELLALAVTYGESPHRKALAGLRAIGELAGVARRVLVYRGNEERRTRDGIETWPLRRFLDALEGGGLWPR